MTTAQLPRTIGTSVKRKEDPRLISGEGAYTDDVQLRGMLYMAVLRSPHAHARISHLDVSAAKAHPEVVSVLTGQEILERCAAPLPLHGVLEDMKARGRWATASELVRYVGEPVAAAVATSREAAKDALELIDVGYDLLPSALDMEGAIQEGAPLVHADLCSNLCFEYSHVVGDPDAAFREADGVVSARVPQPRVIPSPMEPRAVVASFEKGQGTLTIWDTTQEPHGEQTEIAGVLGFPHNKVRVIAVDVGGGFGCKMQLYPEPVIASMFSMQLARPVKWVEERQEHFVSTIHGRGHLTYVDAAYSVDGILLGMRLRYYNDLGAYCNGSSANVIGLVAPVRITGMYRVQNVAWTTVGVYTNKVPFGAYRGYAGSTVSYVIERVMALIADELKMDPVEVRRKNVVPKSAFPYITATGAEYDSGDYEGALELILGLSEYEKLRQDQEQARARGELMGIGIASAVEFGGLGPTFPTSGHPGFESASVRVDPSGTVTALTGTSPHGQGLETTLAQVVADELGVPLKDVDVVHGDTAIVPHGNGTFSGRSLIVGGSALIKASGLVKEKAERIAAALLHIDPEHVSLEGGRFFAEDIPDRYVTWTEVAREAYQPQYMPMDMERGLEATAFWEPLKYTYGHCANVAVVRVDRDTGEVKLTKYALLDDCGNAINPMVVEGQLHGAVAQCLGQALLEEVVWDDTGQPLTGSFLDYAMPMAEDFPTFTLEHTVTPSLHNPMGAKGGGEMGSIVATSAIVNAVVDALSPMGVTHLDIPLTPEKVWRVLKAKGGAA